MIQDTPIGDEYGSRDFPALFTHLTSENRWVWVLGAAILILGGRWLWKNLTGKVSAR